MRYVDKCDDSVAIPWPVCALSAAHRAANPWRAMGGMENALPQRSSMNVTEHRPTTPPCPLASISPPQRHGVVMTLWNSSCRRRTPRVTAGLAVLVLALAGGAATAAETPQANPVPRIVTRDGRH